MPHIHVVTRKEELETAGLEGKVAVVLDVLFATSTIVQALAAGAVAVIPAANAASARTLAAALPQGGALLAGELNAESIPGFAHYAPLALAEAGLQGRVVVYSTTNGTVALGMAAGAAEVYAGAIINAPATARRLVETHWEQDLLLVCAGSTGRFNLEDFYGAGHLLELLLGQADGHWVLSDAALAARALHSALPAVECLQVSRVGRMMLDRGLGHEVLHASRSGAVALAARLWDGRITAV